MEQIINSTKTKALSQLLSDAVQRLTDTVAVFSETDFNLKPFEGSWTGAQVVEHVIKSMTLIHQMVNDTAEPTVRNPEEHIPFLQGIMENMDVKAQSAEIILPGEKPLSPSEIQKRLQVCLDDFLEDIRRLDLSETCMAFEFPGLGLMTRIEFISFSAFHAERHNKQLENIRNILTRPLVNYK